MLKTTNHVWMSSLALLLFTLATRTLAANQAQDPTHASATSSRGSPVSVQVLSLLLVLGYTFGTERYARHGSKTARAVSDNSSRSTVITIVSATIFPFAGALSLFDPLAMPPLPTVVVAFLFAVELFAIWLRYHSMHILGIYFTRSLKVQEGQRVIQSGPYAYIRHPGYLANLLAFFAHAVLVSQNYGVFAIVFCAMAVVWSVRIDLEERMLVSELGAAYVAYQQRTKRLIPFVL
ncbi:isoprenylcysteine carboxyl methyltransferase [Capsaspora owczarzaki ATCC 30864]|uniref:Protein-S-isoprenylcysteine O-methyltransferase n=1 Tax=Capsaspora owczarzaki (strain ATCC 30864) TaxID=595528 RepID=A0A0D2WL85_CAPO3|nr:isoprenylcysteine carboxyl methyltransferase [Capsaspora owczarzaki ATCC 30864]KJE91280.1 isoprenylcysteine carboxyl methyltransferase [Capsaspora owczarzaki ATCC 30864]|eukprot:XP_004349189.2 isoprenylcysteine carboxyl methyltransferase [Capsaspora owczarzaki ATCC 30864]